MTVHLSYYFIGFDEISPTHFSNGVIDAVILVSKSPFWLISWSHWHLIQTQEARRELLFYRQDVCKVEGARQWAQWLILWIFWHESIKCVQYFCWNRVAKLKPHICLCSVTSILTGSQEEHDKVGATEEGSCVGRVLVLLEQRPFGTVGGWGRMALTHCCSVRGGGPDGEKENSRILEGMQRPRWESILRKLGGEGRKKARLRRLGWPASWIGLEGFWRWSAKSFGGSYAFSTLARTNYPFWKSWEGWSESLSEPQVWFWVCHQQTHYMTQDL